MYVCMYTYVLPVSHVSTRSCTCAYTYVIMTYVRIIMHYAYLDTGVRSRGAGGAVAPHDFGKATHPSYYTYCDTALAVVV